MADAMIKQPHVGEILYRGKDGTGAVQVVRIDGTTVWVVPFRTEIWSTHQGNLYDIDGNNPYHV